MARPVHQSSKGFSGHPDLSIPSSQPRTPTIEDKEMGLDDTLDVRTSNDQQGRGAYEFLQIPLQNLSQETATGSEKQKPVPPEYRLSRTSQGTLPNRVLHLKDRNSTAYSEDEGLQPGEKLDDAADVEKEAASAGSYTPSRSRSHTSKEEKDPNVVDWDGPNDPENPMNWKSSKKLAVVSLASVITFLTYV